MLHAGQGVLGKVRFADGQMPTYPRTYIVISVTVTEVGLLIVSSVAGKEHKLLFPTNLHIMNYDPPFLKDSFVKLDSLTYVCISDASQMQILHNGDLLNQTELSNIISSIIY
jgi:hypothetical protein